MSFGGNRDPQKVARIQNTRRKAWRSTAQKPHGRHAKCDGPRDNREKHLTGGPGAESPEELAWGIQNWWQNSCHLWDVPTRAPLSVLLTE